MPLRLEITKSVGCATARIEGEIDLATKSQLEDGIDRLERHPVDLVLDLGGGGHLR
jgi:anti-anti-sigma regulatory factor